jgi:hypothetical protein
VLHLPKGKSNQSAQVQRSQARMPEVRRPQETAASRLDRVSSLQLGQRLDRELRSKQPDRGERSRSRNLFLL